MNSWAIVTKPLRVGPIPLGTLSRLEFGPFYRGPATPLINWWWRPTMFGAYVRALREAQENPR